MLKSLIGKARQFGNSRAWLGFMIFGRGARPRKGRTALGIDWHAEARSLREGSVEQSFTGSDITGRRRRKYYWRARCGHLRQSNYLYASEGRLRREHESRREWRRRVSPHADWESFTNHKAEKNKKNKKRGPSATAQPRFVSTSKKKKRWRFFLGLFFFFRRAAPGVPRAAPVVSEGRGTRPRPKRRVSFLIVQT